MFLILSIIKVLVSLSQKSFTSLSILYALINIYCSPCFRKPTTEVSAKRRRIQQSSAVITHDEYIAAAYGDRHASDQNELPVIFHATDFEEVIIHDIPPSPISSVAIPVVQFPRPVVKSEDFVLIRVIPTGKRRESVYFAGSVIRKLDTALEIKCMRRNGLIGARFV